MTHDDEFISQLEGYLDEHEGATPLPNDVRDALRAALPTTRQRPAWWPDRRIPTMNKFVTIGLGAAAVVVLLFVGARFLGSPTSLGGPGPEPTGTAATTSGQTAEPTPPSTGGVEPGPFVIWDNAPDVGPITVNIARDGWYADRAAHLITTTPPSSADTGMLVFAGDLWVYGHPCQWSTTTPDTPATTVDEIVAALGSQALRDASEPVDISVSGYAGKAVTLHVPGDTAISECDRGIFGLLAEASGGEVNTTPSRYNQGPGQIDEVWVLDVNGAPVVFDLSYFDDTPQDVIDDMRAMVESATFGE